MYLYTHFAEVTLIQVYTKHAKYSGPSLSGRSQHRPPSLKWSEIFAATTTNVFTSPSHQRSSPMWPQFLGNLIREGLLYPAGITIYAAVFMRLYPDMLTIYRTNTVPVIGLCY